MSLKNRAFLTNQKDILNKNSYVCFPTFSASKIPSHHDHSLTDDEQNSNLLMTTFLNPKINTSDLLSWSTVKAFFLLVEAVSLSQDCNHHLDQGCQRDLARFFTNFAHIKFYAMFTSSYTIIFLIHVMERLS